MMCQLFVSFAFAQPLRIDGSIDFTVREHKPVFFETFFAKKMSHYGVLQYLAECSRMYSVTCNDFSYDGSLVMREMRRIHAIMSNHEDTHGVGAPVPPEMQNFIGTCIT